MARPKNADAEQTRTRLRQAALASFAARGREGTSLRQVAADAGVSLATIHHYFGNKEALYQACLDAMAAELQRAAQPFAEEMEALLETLASSADAPVDPRALLRQIVRRSFTFACDQRDALRILMRPLLDRGELDPIWREGVLLPFMDSFVAQLAPMLGAPAESLRMGMHSLLMLGARYALSSPAELMRLARVADEAEARAAVERHLLDCAELLLWQGRRP